MPRMTRKKTGPMDVAEMRQILAATARNRTNQSARVQAIRVLREIEAEERAGGQPSQGQSADAFDDLDELAPPGARPTSREEPSRTFSAIR